jgi:hypothetical protein
MKLSIRNAVLLAAFSLAAPALAGTSISWTGPGWYLFGKGTTESSPNAPLSGPFLTEDLCKAQIESWEATDAKDGKDDMTYSCQHHEVAWPA